jgi:conjugative relaxase-like TrwC/TraI family protein
MGKMRDGAQWLSNHYAANDYYCEGEKVVGTWVGKGAEIVGIEGRSIEPQDEAFLAIFSGKIPSGEKLKQRNSDIIGYDFQCSAQKSVSIMAILGDDGRLFEAHRAAVTEGYQALETLGCIQGREEQGSKRRTTTGVLCSARFEHDTSRALDPHIHTHFATANFSITPEGRRYALETHDMVKAIRYCGKIYQSALRRKVVELGYHTRDKFNERRGLSRSVQRRLQRLAQRYRHNAKAYRASLRGKCLKQAQHVRRRALQCSPILGALLYLRCLRPRLPALDRRKHAEKSIFCGSGTYGTQSKCAARCRCGQ